MNIFSVDDRHKVCLWTQCFTGDEFEFVIWDSSETEQEKAIQVH